MEHVQRKMTQMVREYETKLYEKQLEEVGRFSLKERRLSRKHYRDHSCQILDETPWARASSCSAHWSLPEQGLWWGWEEHRKKLMKIKAMSRRMALVGGRCQGPHLSDCSSRGCPAAGDVSSPCLPLALYSPRRCRGFPCTLVPFICVCLTLVSLNPFILTCSFITAVL